MVEIVPVIARPPVEKIAPRSGVRRVVPQVGQPAPRAISPVMIPAFSTLAEFFESLEWCFLFHNNTMRPIKVPCSTDMAKIGSQSKNGWLIPKMLIKLSHKIWSPCGKPRANMSSNLEKPPESIFIRTPKNIKVGTKPHQKRFSLVASRMPLPAMTKSSNHFLQFIVMIIA